jgi:hypothetical protein
MLTELTQRFPELQLVAPIERMRSNFINGIRHLHVDLGPPA